MSKSVGGRFVFYEGDLAKVCVMLDDATVCLGKFVGRVFGTVILNARRKHDLEHFVVQGG